MLTVNDTIVTAEQIKPASDTALKDTTLMAQETAGMIRLVNVSNMTNASVER